MSTIWRQTNAFAIFLDSLRSIQFVSRTVDEYEYAKHLFQTSHELNKTDKHWANNGRFCPCPLPYPVSRV